MVQGCESSITGGLAQASYAAGLASKALKEHRTHPDLCTAPTNRRMRMRMRHYVHAAESMHHNSMPGSLAWNEFMACSSVQRMYRSTSTEVFTTPAATTSSMARFMPAGRERMQFCFICTKRC